ncbi:CBO0543 family protein [Salicibibacter kimchii]|uniref:CBO0543 family protein n=1 Tax=Salicibibacter kimchii TaxID=2099786 RepID=UPI0013595122|nr:CBO0543 family protein [Salicibibacter kimchii]
MERSTTRIITRIIFVLCLVFLPFTLGKKRVKEWGLIFFATGYLASILAQLAVKAKKIKYPVRPFPRYFDGNVVYEYLVLPLFCVWFNQSTYHAKIWSIIGTAFLYSSAHTLIEYFVEKKTGAVRWKAWNWLFNTSSLASVLIVSRSVLSLWKWLSKRYDQP